METTEIRLKIHEEADMFNPYDADGKMLSEDVSDYLTRCYENKHRRITDQLVIHVVSDTPVDEERVKQVLRSHCEQEKSNNRYEMRQETFREICLAVLGVIFLSLWVFLSATREGVWMEVLSIMGWVAVWEATSIAIMRRPELYHVKKTYDRVSKARIVVEVTGSEEA